MSEAEQYTYNKGTRRDRILAQTSASGRIDIILITTTLCGTGMDFALLYLHWHIRGMRLSKDEAGYVGEPCALIFGGCPIIRVAYNDILEVQTATVGRYSKVLPPKKV